MRDLPASRRIYSTYVIIIVVVFGIYGTHFHVDVKSTGKDERKCEHREFDQ